jgi:hypothetical protein
MTLAHGLLTDSPLEALLAALAGGVGATTTEIAGVVHRRRADVLAELLRLEARGLVERFPDPRPHAHNRRVWNLAKDAPGTAGEQREGFNGAQATDLPSLTATSFSGGLRACQRPEHFPHQWKAPSGEAVCGLCEPPSVSAALARGWPGDPA